MICREFYGIADIESKYNIKYNTNKQWSKNRFEVNLGRGECANLRVIFVNLEHFEAKILISNWVVLCVATTKII